MTSEDRVVWKAPHALCEASKATIAQRPPRGPGDGDRDDEKPMGDPPDEDETDDPNDEDEGEGDEPPLYGGPHAHRHFHQRECGPGTQPAVNASAAHPPAGASPAGPWP